MVESQPSKLLVASSILVSRSNNQSTTATAGVSSWPALAATSWLLVFDQIP